MHNFLKKTFENENACKLSCPGSCLENKCSVNHK